MRRDCPVCGRAVLVRADQRLRRHRDNAGQDCPGGETELPDRLSRMEAAETDAVRLVVALHPEHERGLMDMGKIGRQAGVSRERVRQIYEDRGLAHGHELAHYRAQARRLFEAVAFAAKKNTIRAHGTARRYALGCTCEECRRANNLRCRASKPLRSKHVCEVCGESVWSTKGGMMRHFRNADHAPVPVPRV